MRKWLVLASHDQNGTRTEKLDLSDADSLERVTYIISGDGERPMDGDISEALADYGDGEYLFVPLDGDTFTGGLKVVHHVEVQWSGNYV